MRSLLSSTRDITGSDSGIKYPSLSVFAKKKIKTVKPNTLPSRILY